MQPHVGIYNERNCKVLCPLCINKKIGKKVTIRIKLDLNEGWREERGQTSDVADYCQTAKSLPVPFCAYP